MGCRMGSGGIEEWGGDGSVTFKPQPIAEHGGKERERRSISLRDI